MALSVLQLLPALEEGGVEQGTIEISRALVDAGHHALVVSRGGRLTVQLDAMGAEHLAWPVGRKSPLVVRWIPRLRRLFSERRIDVVHARSRLPAWLAFLACRGLPAEQRPRFVTTAHGFYSVNRYSEIMTRGERVIAVSKTIRRYLVEHYPRLDPERVALIYRGVDDDRFPRGFAPAAEWQTRWRAEHPELEGKFLILLAGRLRRLKGHHELLDLMARLSIHSPRAHALIAGDDTAGTDYIRSLKTRVVDENLPVTFLGFREDLRELYATANLVLSLSTQPESFGRTVLEALCLGTPVVGYAQGGVGEILDAMFAEGKVVPGDSAALCETVRDFIRSPRRVSAENAFPLAEMQHQTIRLYELLVDEQN